MADSPLYNTVIARLFTELDILLNNYIGDGYNALANHLREPLGIAVVLFIVLMGISISQGWVKLSMANFIKAALKIGLIYSFAMHWTLFSDWIVTGIEGSAGQIGDWLVQATPMHIPSFAGLGINEALQLVLTEFTEIGQWVWDLGSIGHLSPYFSALIIWGFGYALVLVAVFEILLAKIMLAILFVTAPLFIGFTLFKITHPFFDRWLGAIVGFALMLIFVSAMLALALSITQWALVGVYADHAANTKLVSFVPILIVGFLGIGVILKAAQLAQSIGGTVASTAGSELLAGTVGGFIGAGLRSSNTVGQGAGQIWGTIKGAQGLGQGVGKKIMQPSELKHLRQVAQKGE